MAIRIQRTVIDDIDQSTDSVDTYRFALEGVDYEIDLADHNIDRLRAALYPFVAAARRLPRRTSGKPPGGASRANSNSIRQWWHAHQNDLDLPAYNARGPIPHKVSTAFRTTAGQPEPHAG
ncbi:Lsr2 family protein [Actinoplanes sp. M2I2]|uniref:histone-like nucleoid-structuring protein Lsr2 n=1 Tax=Actinoplanes sp. M2I2 TaxID=1734444 RepID=UPI0020207AB7|nr:Lsr2 family protein [Actinoplanes sp. M2I2]